MPRPRVSVLTRQEGRGVEWAMPSAVAGELPKARRGRVCCVAHHHSSELERIFLFWWVCFGWRRDFNLFLAGGLPAFFLAPKTGNDAHGLKQGGISVRLASATGRAPRATQPADFLGECLAWLSVATKIIDLPTTFRASCHPILKTLRNSRFGRMQVWLIPPR